MNQRNSDLGWINKANPHRFNPNKPTLKYEKLFILTLIPLDDQLMRAKIRNARYASF